MLLSELRQKYPQYSDMSDQEFSDAFHGKFYKDMPKEEFYQKIGFKTQPEAKTTTKPRETTLREDLAIPATEAIITSGKGLGAIVSGAADLVGQHEWADELRNKINRGAEYWRKLANPDKAEQSGLAKLGGLAASLPVQFMAMPFQGARSGMEFLDAGESIGAAQSANLFDTAAAIGGAAIPVKGAGIVPGLKQLVAGAGNVGTNLASSVAKSAVAKTEEGKKLSQYTEEQGITDLLTGAALASLPGGKGANKTKLDRLKNIKEAEAARKPVEAPAPEQLELPLETSAQTIAEQQARQGGQMDLFAPVNQQLEGRVPNVSPEAVRPPIPDEAQLNLPFSDSPETIAAMQRAGDVQGDLFIDTNAPHQDYNAMDAYQRQLDNHRKMLEASMADLEAAKRAGVAQEAIDARARALQEEMARNTALYQQAAERARQEAAPTGYSEWKANRDVEDAARSAEQLRRMNEAPEGQGHLDFNDFGNNDPMERMPNMRVDENGIPIRADLSMEAQNLQNPLQINMWGDELGPALEQTRSLTDAIDSMPPGKERDAAIANASGTAPGFGTKRYRGPASQRGAVDTSLFTDISDVISRKLKNGWTFSKITGPEHPGYAISDANGNQIASLTLQKNGDNAEVGRVWVDPEYRNQGIAEALYQKALNSGNDIVRSTNQTEAGKAMWNHWEQTGKSVGGIRRSQQGAIDFEALGLGVSNFVNKQRAAFNDIVKGGKLSTDMIPEDVPVEKILANAAKEKDNTSWNALEAGNAMRAAKSRASWVRDTWDLFQNAVKRQEINVRNYVTGATGAERALRSLSKQERYELAEVLKSDMFDRNKTSPEMLQEAGFTGKQLEAMAKLREMQDAALAAINYGRQVQGKPPIDANEAYLTSAWSGERKMRVLDKDGNVVYYLADNSKSGLNKQWEALKKEFPEYTAEEVQRSPGTWRGADVEQAYSVMADAIGRDNPEFKKIQEWYTAYQATNAHSAMGTEKHFKPKANIRGFVGDRPGMNPISEATALLQRQMDFAKESFHWAALQDGAVKMAPVFQDQNIRDNHPNNLAYLQEQFRIAAGANDGAMSRAVDSAIREFGLTPAQVFGGAQQAKGWFMFQKLGFNLGYGLANVLQLPYTVPHLADIGNKFGGFNPARSVGVATALSLPMAGAHYARQSANIDLFRHMDDSFFRRMFDYAEQNGVTSRSIVDEAPIDAGPIGRVANFTTSAPEALIRSFSFALYADALHQTGKLSEMEVFKEAERRVNMSLGDFRETERAPIFSRMGNIGNILNTLQTYGVNYYQQANYFLRESAKGNPAPLALFAATQLGLAGISGMPGMQDAEKLWDFFKKLLPNETWAKVGNFDPRMWAYEKFGATGVDGLFSTLTGISVNSRVSAPDAEAAITAPGGPLIDVAKQIGSVVQLAGDPYNKRQQAETAMKLAPTGITGYLETNTFRDQTSVQQGDKRLYWKSNNLGDKTVGAYPRTPQEENLRQYGFRSPKEVAERNMDWKAGSFKAEAGKRKNSFADEFYNAVMNGDKEKASSLETAYTKVYGQSINDSAMQLRIKQTYMSDMQRMMANADKATPAELIRLSKVKKIMDMYPQ